jgi:hypothetical protein
MEVQPHVNRFYVVELEESFEERRPVISVGFDEDVRVDLLISYPQEPGLLYFPKIPTIHAWKPLPRVSTRLAKHPEEEGLVGNLGTVPELYGSTLAPPGVSVRKE